MTETVLVIEDNADNLEIISLILRAAGYRVIGAQDGLKGLKMARMTRPDLVVLDLVLPRVDGWTVARELRADPRLGHIPILAISAKTSGESRSRAVQAGCDDFVPKPADLLVLPDLVARYLAAKKVLVIEDDPDSLGIVRIALKAAGYTVLVARDGEAGLRLAKETHPDLVVLDLVLPQMQGWDVARELRADPELRDVPVVAMTIYDSPDYHTRAAQAGCNEFLVKPFDLGDFASVVGGYLQ